MWSPKYTHETPKFPMWQVLMGRGSSSFLGGRRNSGFLVQLSPTPPTPHSQKENKHKLKEIISNKLCRSLAASQATLRFYCLVRSYIEVGIFPSRLLLDNYAFFIHFYLVFLLHLNGMLMVVVSKGMVEQLQGKEKVNNANPGKKNLSNNVFFFE